MWPADATAFLYLMLVVMRVAYVLIFNTLLALIILAKVDTFTKQELSISFSIMWRVKFPVALAVVNYKVVVLVLLISCLSLPPTVLGRVVVFGTCFVLVFVTQY